LIKKILFVIGALAFVIAIISLVHSVGTLNAVTLTPSNDITIEFGQVGSVGMGKSIIKTSSVQTVHVSAGTYAVVFTRPGYSSVFTQITVTRDMKITPPVLSPSPASLATTLSKNIDTIHSAITASIPAGYGIANEQLLGDGSWYGATLASTNASQDMLRIIAHKNKSSWILSAGPEIVIPAASFPDIPDDVISSVNNTL
jgi:hypothetical protein